jgi:cobalt transporter subunit CbtB
MMNDPNTAVAKAAVLAPEVVRARDRSLKLGLAFLLGASLVFLVGFAQPQAVHDAAHDTRHSLAFPCH